MDKILDYFLDKNGKRRHFMVIRNKSKKPVTFSWGLPSHSYDAFKEDYHELLKTELICSNPLSIINFFSKQDASISDSTFWCFKKGNCELVGIAFPKFVELLKSREGYDFVYPIIKDHYLILFCGKAGKTDTYKLFVYFNNFGNAYHDLISLFKKRLSALKLKTDIKVIGRVDLDTPHFFDKSEAIPKVVATAGMSLSSDYVPFFYLMKRPNSLTYFPFNQLSHIVAINNETTISYTEKHKFIFVQGNYLKLDELLIATIRAVKPHLY
jgi:hypothetical protein